MALIIRVGKLSKWLFGTLDSEHQEKYDSEIKSFKENLKSIEHEPDLQASLNRHLISHYNETITIWKPNGNQK